MAPPRRRAMLQAMGAATSDGYAAGQLHQGLLIPSLRPLAGQAGDYRHSLVARARDHAAQSDPAVLLHLLEPVRHRGLLCGGLKRSRPNIGQRRLLSFGQGCPRILAA